MSLVTDDQRWASFVDVGSRRVDARKIQPLTSADTATRNRLRRGRADAGPRIHPHYGWQSAV
jgi:hypothetical protein